MASLFQRTRAGQKSRFWWVQTKENGKWIKKPTPYRIAVNADTLAARTYVAELTLAERKGAQIGDANWIWVESFLRARYDSRTKTLERYTTAWRTIQLFLRRETILSPASLLYTHIQRFVDWRKTFTGEGVWKCGHNNAVLEVKILGLLMKEAVRRGMCQGNPCAGCGLQKKKPDAKPEITNEELATIRAALLKEPEWMMVAFEIAIHQGCRLRETSIPLKNIDLKRSRITFAATKGNKPFTTMLHPDLVPLVKQLIAKQRQVTCDVPKMASKAWWLFFRRVNLRHLCFHCTRVTVITRLARRGVPMAQAMRFVNHSSEAVHRIYQRLSVDDVDAAVKALRGIGKPQSLDDSASTSTPARG